MAPSAQPRARSGPSPRSAAMKRTGLPAGRTAAWSWTRAPRRARPDRRRRLFVMPVSSRKTKRWIPVGRRSCHRCGRDRQVDRAEGRTLFLLVTSRAGTARQIVARLAVAHERGLGGSAIVRSGLRRDQTRPDRCGANIDAARALDPRCDCPSRRRRCFRSRTRGPDHAVFTRARPSSRSLSVGSCSWIVGLHRLASESSVCRSTTTSPRVQGLREKRLIERFS